MSSLGAVCAIGLLAAACGGGGGTGEDADGTADSATGNGATGDTAERTFDPSLLPTTPVNPALLIDNGLADIGGDGTPSNPALDLDSIVDECSVIDAATVTTIVRSANTLGSSFDFTRETTPRASCLYRSDTHAVEIFVHRADALNNDFMQALNWIGGEVSTRPGGAGGAATLYSEDSFDIVTFYAARAEGNGWAVVVSNVGGTGMLVGADEEEGWGDLALAALDGVVDLDPGDAAPTPSDDGSAKAAPNEGPCGVYEPEDLAGAFAIDFAEENEGIATECLWRSSDSSVTIGLNVGPSGEGPDWFGATEDVGGGVYLPEFGNEAVYSGNGQLYRLSVYVRTEAYGLEPYEGGGARDRDSQPMVDALVANLIERTS